MVTETKYIQGSDNKEVVSATRRDTNRASWTYRPNVDIFDTADELLLMADIPGASPENVDVSMDTDILTIQASVTPRKQFNADCTYNEFGVGGFHRRFEIKEAIDTEAVTAECKDGTLTVHMPKLQNAKRRRIPVTT